jgi:hypothetical protein
MLKVADLFIKVTEHSESRLQLTVRPGYRDYIITGGIISFAVWFFSAVLEDSPWMGLTLFLVGVTYALSNLEHYVTVTLDKDQGIAKIEKKRIMIPYSTIVLQLDEVSGASFEEKDLHMDGKFAQRLQLTSDKGYAVPLSNAFVIQDDLLKSMKLIVNEITAFLGTDANSTDWQ